MTWCMIDVPSFTGAANGAYDWDMSPEFARCWSCRRRWTCTAIHAIARAAHPTANSICPKRALPHPAMRAFGPVPGGSFGNKMVPQWEPCAVTCEKRSKTASDPAMISTVMITPVATRHDRLGAGSAGASLIQTACPLIGRSSQGPKPLPSACSTPPSAVPKEKWTLRSRRKQVGVSSAGISSLFWEHASAK